MQIVIEISEEVKQAFDRASSQDIYGCYYDYNSVIGKAIKNGIVLPKGYGALYDGNELKNYFIKDDCDTGCGYLDERDFKNIKPLVEADNVNICDTNPFNDTRFGG